MWWIEWAIWIIFLSPIWGAFLWEILDGIIRPNMIPQKTVVELAEELLDKHGENAGRIAFIEEDRAWRYSDSFEQGKWRRVRRCIDKITEASGSI